MLLACCASVLPAFNVTLTPKKSFLNLEDSELQVEVSARSVNYSHTPKICWSCCFIVVVHRPHVTSSVPPPTLTHVVVMASQVPVRGAGSGDGLRGVWGEDQPGDEKVAFSEAGFKRKSLIVVKRCHHIMRASRMMFIYIGSPSEPAASITSDVFCVLLLLQLDGGVVSLSMEEIKRVYPNVKSLVGNSVYVKASVLTKSG